MSYIPPEDVKSPKAFWTLIAVLDPGKEGTTAVALGRWEGKPCIGSRWNGYEGHEVGTPNSRGIPVWYIQEDRYANAIINALPSPEMRKLAREHIPESKH